ncbi:MAG: PEP-CTERM sorting domain-containing protein [Bryobacteraceae bacterium]
MRCLGIGALLAALPFLATASPVVEDFTFNIGGTPGTGEVTFDPSHALTDAYGPYVNASPGLTEFDLSFESDNYTISDALAAEVFLPGNDYNNTIAAGHYAVFGFWVVPGSESGGFESLIGVTREGKTFLLTGVEASTISFGGSGSSLTLQVCPAGDCPNYQVTMGSITPEPSLLPLSALGLAGLWFARRRRASL